MTQSPHSSRRKRILNGVLLLNKDRGLSSNSALQRARFLFGAAKAGHTGILDPLADGLLPVCFGEATKFSQYLLDADKTYLATLCIGAATTTGDAEGEIIAEAASQVSSAQLAAAITAFTGRITQTPPMYSALKHQGKPLYEYARAGITIERKTREVTIYQIELIKFDLPIIVLKVTCSKGTYIRTLAEDMAKHMGTLAYLTGLQRLTTAGFHLDNAYSLATLNELEETARDQLLLPCDVLVQHLPKLELADNLILRLQQGQRVHVSENYGTISPLRIYTSAGQFIGLAGYQPEESSLRSLRLMNTATAVVHE